MPRFSGACLAWWGINRGKVGRPVKVGRCGKYGRDKSQEYDIKVMSVRQTEGYVMKVTWMKHEGYVNTTWRLCQYDMKIMSIRHALWGYVNSRDAVSSQDEWENLTTSRCECNLKDMVNREVTSRLLVKLQATCVLVPQYRVTDLLRARYVHLNAQVE
jgi:hypothetical protein